MKTYFNCRFKVGDTICSIKHPLLFEFLITDIVMKPLPGDGNFLDEKYLAYVLTYHGTWEFTSIIDEGYQLIE